MTAKGKRDSELSLNIPYEPIVYNYQDFARVDHRLKLYLFQTVLEDRDEKFVWLCRGYVCENDETFTKLGTGYNGIFVMTTTKFYVMRMVAEEEEEITNWLRRQLAVNVNRVERVKVLPWLVGVSLSVKGLGAFNLILQDEARTEALMNYLKSELNLMGIRF